MIRSRFDWPPDKLRRKVNRRAAAARAALFLIFCSLGPVPRQIALAFSSFVAARSSLQGSPQAADLDAQGFELLSRNDALHAEAAFRKAIEIQPELAAAHRGLGLSLWAGGNPALALKELKVAAVLDPGNAETQYDLARLAWEMAGQSGLGEPGASNGQKEDYLGLAIASMRRATSLRPRSLEIRLSAAEVYLEARRPEDAVAEAEEAVRLEPSSPAAHVTLGRAYLAEAEENKAEFEFNAALGVGPADGRAHLELGQLRLLQRKMPEALEEFRRATRASPNLAPAHAALGELLVRLGQPLEARRDLEKAIALDARDWRSQYWLAVLLMEAGEAGRATQLFKDVARIRPDFLPAREQGGLALLRRGDPPGAEAEAEGLLPRNPRAAEGHRLLALLLWKRRDDEASLAECAMALETEPESAQILALQALELWQLNQKMEARRAFAQAAKVEPNVAKPDVFCRLLLCDAKDLGPVEDFLRRNRAVLLPTPSP